MQAKCHQHEECQHISACNAPKPMPHISPDIVAVSDDDSSVDSSPHVEMSESEGQVWLDHPNVTVNYT